MPTPGTGWPPLGGSDGGGAPLAIGTKMSLLAAMVRTLVRLGRSVGESGAEARTAGAVGKTERMPLEGRAVLMDWGSQRYGLDRMDSQRRTPEATLDGTEAVADATESEESGAEPIDAIRLLATARDTDVVNDMAAADW
jgi:hypothetical protein